MTRQHGDDPAKPAPHASPAVPAPHEPQGSAMRGAAPGDAAERPTPLDVRRPFTRADGVAAGISPKILRSSRFRRIFHDVHISAEVRDCLDDRVRAALLLHPDQAWASHTTAAALYQVVVPPSSLVHVSVFDPKDRRWCAGIKPHVAPKHTDVTTLRGMRISAPFRLYVELAAVLELVDLVVAGDNMLRVFGISAQKLRNGLADSHDYWSSAARHGASFVRDDVDSPMETRLRMLLVLAGLPEPEVNLRIRNEHGDVVLRFDLAYREARLAVEFEGRHHVEVVRQWEKDIDRDELADQLDWRLIKITSNGIFVDPGRTVLRVWEALRARGQLVPRPTDAWRPYFPGRRSAG